MRSLSPLRAVNLACKVALIALLLHAVAFPDLPQYQGKGIGWRLAFYPLSTVVVPIVWWTRARAARRRSPQERTGSPRRGPVSTAYPDLIDICVVAPFLIDTAGNAANFYDSVTWWDDLMHIVTWIPWVMAVGLALRYLPLGRLNVAALTVGFGAVTHILWEYAEYVSFVQGNASESATAYRDTIGDLMASLSGSFIGGALVATVLWDIGRPRPVAERCPNSPSAVAS